MKSATLLVTAFLAVASLVSAAPTAKYIESRAQQSVILPDTIIQIKEDEPDYAFGNTSWGLVSRDDGSSNVQTLLSIYIPQTVSGLKCQYIFVNPDDAQGSMSAQLFTVIGGIPLDATFNHRPSRDRQLATFKVSGPGGGNAQWTFFGGDSFVCQGGQTLNLEVVPVGDNDYIGWHKPYGLAVVASSP